MRYDAMDRSISERSMPVFLYTSRPAGALEIRQIDHRGASRRACQAQGQGALKWLQRAAVGRNNLH